MLKKLFSFFQNKENLFEKGFELCQQHDYEGAERLWLKALKEPDPRPELYLNLGNLLVLQERFSEAVDFYQQAIAHGLDDAETHSNLGVALKHSEHFEEALVAHHRAFELSPNDSTTLLNFAGTLVSLERFDEAEKYLRRALDSNQEDDIASVSLCLGNLLLCKEMPKESLEHFERAKGDELLRVDALVGLLRAFGPLGDRKKFMECLKECVPLGTNPIDRLEDTEIPHKWPEFTSYLAELKQEKAFTYTFLGTGEGKPIIVLSTESHLKAAQAQAIRYLTDNGWKNFELQQGSLVLDDELESMESELQEAVTLARENGAHCIVFED